MNAKHAGVTPRTIVILFALATSAAPTIGAHAGPVTLAPNDNCANAMALAAGQVVTGNNVLALDDYQARDGSGANAQDVVFTFDLDAPGQAIIDVAGSEYQIDLYIRTDCEDPSSEVAFEARTSGKGIPPFDTLLPRPLPAPLLANLPAGKYYLFLDADNGAGVPYRLGNYRLRFDVGPPVRGDRCDYPFELPLEGSVQGSTRTMFDDYRTESAGFGGRDVVFEVTASSPTTLHIDTTGSTFDTVLYVRSSCDDPATEIASTDDEGQSWQAALDVTVPAGTSFVILDGWDRTASGAFKVTVS